MKLLREWGGGIRCTWMIGIYSVGFPLVAVLTLRYSKFTDYQAQDYVACSSGRFLISSLR